MVVSALLSWLPVPSEPAMAVPSVAMAVLSWLYVGSPLNDPKDPAMAVLDEPSTVVSVAIALLSLLPLPNDPA